MVSGRSAQPTPMSNKAAFRQPVRLHGRRTVAFFEIGTGKSGRSSSTMDLDSRSLRCASKKRDLASLAGTKTQLMPVSWENGKRRYPLRQDQTQLCRSYC